MVWLIWKQIVKEKEKIKITFLWETKKNVVMITDFIIIQIESIEIMNYRKSRVEYAINRINQDYTFLDKIKIFYYNLFKWILNKLWINYIYTKTFKIKELNINDLKINKCLLFKITEKGIYINESFISYEYIITFKTKVNELFIQLFGSVETIDDNLIIKPSKSIVNVVVKFQKKQNVVENIKKNMYYHIKYNKINEDAIDYFKEKIN